MTVRRDPFRQLNSIDTELQIGVIVAYMQLAERVLSDTGCLQQEPVERLVVALRLGFDCLSAKVVNRCTEARLDFTARDVELSRDDVEVEGYAAFGTWRCSCRRRGGLCHRYRRLSRRGRCFLRCRGAGGKNRSTK